MGVVERREREFKRREHEILDAALRLFDRDDWRNVTIEEIAHEAEIGKGTVYLHFPSKEEIYARLAIDFERRLLDALRRIDPSLPPLEQMRAAIRLFFAMHRAAQGPHRVVDYCGREDFRRSVGEAARQEFTAIGEELTEVIHGILGRGVADGTFPDRPLPVLFSGAHSALAGAVKMAGCGCSEEAELDRDAYEEEIARFVLAGLMYQDRVPDAPADRTN